MIREQNGNKADPFKNADFVTWRVTKDKRELHDREVTRLYNQRARIRPETRH